MKRIYRHILPLFAAISAALLSGCLDSDEKIVLNPDGSGKAHIKILMSEIAISVNDEKPKPDKVARDTAVGLIGGAKGVEAWSDVKCIVNDQGKTEFTAIAYFQDIRKYAIGSMKSDSMDSNGLESIWTMVEKDGVVTLSMHPLGGGDEKAEPAKPPADIEAAIKQERMEFQQGKMMMSGFLAEMKKNFTIKVGGEIQSTELFKKGANDVLTASFTGPQLVAGMEKVMMDDSLMRKLAAQGKLGNDDEPTSPEISEKIFGGKAFTITFKPGKSLFDYKAEVTKAKANQPEALKALLKEAAEDDFEGDSGFTSEDEPAGVPDPAFEATAKKHVATLAPSFKSAEGKEIGVIVHSTSKATNDGNQGSIDLSVTLSAGAESEKVTLTITFSKNNDTWKPNGFSAGELPDFAGKGLDKIRSISEWTKRK